MILDANDLGTSCGRGQIKRTRDALAVGHEGPHLERKHVLRTELFGAANIIARKKHG